MDLGEHRMAAEATAVAVTAGAAVALSPGWTWTLATTHPLGFGISLACAGLAWTVRWELREETIQRWFAAGGRFRWFVPAKAGPDEGFWEWTDGRPAPRRTASDVHDEWLTKVGRELEESIR